MTRWICAACALISTPALAADVGLRVLVQPWTPLTDDDTPQRVIDDPTLISGGLHRAWTTSSPELHEALKGILGKGDLLTHGVTLYDLDLRVPEPKLAVVSKGGGGTQPLSLTVTMQMQGLHLEATSTTPDVALGVGLGDYADPRCSIDFDLTAVVPVTLGTDVSRPFSTDLTPAQAADRPIARISNFRFDSHNLSCDLAKMALEVTGYDDELTRAVTDPRTPQARKLNETLITYLQSGLDQANSTLSSVVPPGMVRVGAWAWAGQPITLAFSIRGPLPDPGPRASVTGAFTAGTQESGLQHAVSCKGMPLSAARKAGPRLIVDPMGGLGDAPLEPLDTVLACTTGEDGSVRYTFSGLSASFPNQLVSSSSSGCTTSNPASIAHHSKVSGLPAILLPGDFDGNYDVSSESWSFPCGAKTPAVLSWRDRYDSVVNPADPALNVRMRPELEVAVPVNEAVLDPALAPALNLKAVQQLELQR